MSNNLILLSSSIITISMVIHYSYLNYIQKYRIKPRYDIIITNFIMLFIGWLGLCVTLYKQFNNIKWIIITVVAVCFIYISDLWMGYIDIKNAERSYNGKIIISKSHPRNHISIPLLFNILGWLVLGYTILGPNTKDLHRLYSTMFIIGILFSIYHILPKSRKNCIADNPGYILIVCCWLGLYFLKLAKPSVAKSPINIDNSVRKSFTPKNNMRNMLNV